MNKDKRLEAFGRLLDVMDELRVKCPWDRVQTFESLRSSTIEETYELVDALLDHDMKNVKKELGDLLLHVIFYSKIASEEGAFDIADVADTECDKLIFRHPHVFGAVHADTPDEVKQNWEDLKLKEKEKEQREETGAFGGAPDTTFAGKGLSYQPESGFGRFRMGDQRGYLEQGAGGDLRSAGSYAERRRG